ncbi:MAG: homoserine dehydrogenase [Deltaproteobacteria bacterium]|nr:homoserine dehydrogenase [Deltaproteobacteria bacterium]
MSAETIVIKLGSSVLPDDAAALRGVQEIYREVRAGRRVVCVVSAFGDTTDTLCARARDLAPRANEALYAEFLATGEAAAVLAFALALDGGGIPVETLDVHGLALATTGATLDATPVSVDVEALNRALEKAPVVVVPGFVGKDANGRSTLLGRGGSDLSAIFIAHALEAACRLVKDVDGWFEDDPARTGPAPRRYATLHWDDAIASPAPIVQAKAVEWARRLDRPFEVAALESSGPTTVSAADSAFAPTPSSPRPVRVALLGCGTVGAEVARRLVRETDHELVSVLVRDVDRSRPGVPRAVITDDPAVALAHGADIVIELLGDVELAGPLVRAALELGADVVTANKTLLAHDGTELEALAASRGVRLMGSAAVGGAVPMLETVARIASTTRVARLRGVVNGTCNFVLDAIAAGADLDAAVREAQRLGFAEADPSADLEGRDSADKLRLLARAAFSVDVTDASPPPVLGASSESRAPRRRLVVDAWRDESGDVRSATRIEALGSSDPLATVRSEHNALEITDTSGRRHVVRGRGAGPRPTSVAVLADLADAVRARWAALSPPAEVLA